MLPFLQSILALDILIGAAKIGGYLSSKLRQLAVAGEVFVGLILDPSMLNFWHWPAFTVEHLAETIAYLAELGVFC